MNIDLVCCNCNETFSAEFKHRDKKFCNRKCYFEYAKKNNLIGKQKDSTIREKRTCIECGVEFIEKIKTNRKLCSNECRLKWNSKPNNKTKRIEKSKNALIRKYGTDSLFKDKQFQDKMKSNFQKKYGVSSPMYVEKFIDKLKNTIRNNHIPTLLDKLEKNNIKLIEEYINNKDVNTSRPYTFQCTKCDFIFSSTILGSGKIPICRKCYPISKNSSIENLIRDFLNQNNIKHIDNNRKILNGKEIDILINEKKIGFEINGNYFHSEIYGQKDKNYHINKTKYAYDNEIKLIQIFEDEIILKPEIVISRVGNLLNLTKNKVYARKCDIREVTKKESSFFLEKNHLQGNSIDKIRIGLYYNNELVSLMTFGSKRKVLGNKFKVEKEFELIRFCNILNTNVIGGFSKLLKYFISTYQPNKILTFADIRWSGLDNLNTVYCKNGFKFIENTPPNYWYLKTDDFINRSHRFNFRKDLLMKEGFSENLTEWEIMQEKGYDRIWDCGSMKFELNLND